MGLHNLRLFDNTKSNTIFNTKVEKLGKDSIIILFRFRNRKERILLMKISFSWKRAAQWLLLFLQGAIVGTGAILPGISGGVLCVAFGIYEPLMELLSHPFQSLRKRYKMFNSFVMRRLGRVYPSCPGGRMVFFRFLFYYPGFICRVDLRCCS